MMRFVCTIVVKNYFTLCARLSAVVVSTLFFAFHFHWRNHSNMMKSKQNAKTLHLHTYYLLNDYWFGAVYFDFSFKRFFASDVLDSSSYVRCIRKWLLFADASHYRTVLDTKIAAKRFRVSVFHSFAYHLRSKYLCCSHSIEWILEKNPFISFTSSHVKAFPKNSFWSRSTRSAQCEIDVNSFVRAVRREAPK